jgi:cell division protein FtsZ
LGLSKTQGLGAGANPDVGKEAAEESSEELIEELRNTNMLFLTAGLGGGTGTGALPVIASLAKKSKYSYCCYRINTF